MEKAADSPPNSQAVSQNQHLAPKNKKSKSIFIILGLLLAFLLGMGTMYAWQNYSNLKPISPPQPIIQPSQSPSPSPSGYPIMQPDEETLREWIKSYEEAPLAKVFYPKIVLNFIKESHPETASLIEKIPNLEECFRSPCDKKRIKDSPRIISYKCGSWIATYTLNADHPPYELRVEYKERVIDCNPKSCSCTGDTSILWTGRMKKENAEISETSYINKIKN